MAQYLDLLKRILQEGTKKKVEKTGVICDLFVQSFDTITLTEKGHMLSMMLTGTRRLKKSIDKAYAEQKKTLLLKADFDAREVKGMLDGIVGKLEAYITPPDDVEEDLEELLDADNAEALLSGDELEGDHKRMRRYLIENYYSIYSKIKDSARRADEVLSNLSQLQRAIEQDRQQRETLWEKMLEDYKKQEWPEQEATIIYRIKAEIADPDNKGMTKEQILTREQKRLEIDHLTEIHKRELKELNLTVKDSKHSPIDVIMKHRDKLHEEDLSDYFCFFYSNGFIRDAQDVLLLRQDSEYDLLFFNKAAQEYVELLIPVLKQYGGINDKGHYGILKLVLQDLGLVDLEKANGVQMLDFVNDKMITNEAEKLPSQDSITKVTRKLNGVLFANLESEGLGRTNIRDNREYARMKDVYWRCFTILNYYNLIDVEDAEYDDYLLSPHEVAKKNDLWEDVEIATKNRLTFLSSVLRGEAMYF